MMKYRLENLIALYSIYDELMKAIGEIELDGLELRFKVGIEKQVSKGLKDVLWTDIGSQYMTLVATRMLGEGYICTAVEGGWVVVSPGGEEYQLTEGGCTCGGFSYTGQCKHLMLRDWHLWYRARQGQVKASHQRSRHHH